MGALTFTLILGYALFAVVQKSAAGISAFQLHQDIDVVEFAVESDTASAVVDFCKRYECSFLGKVTRKYFHIKCKERKIKEFGGEKKLQDSAKRFYQIKSLEKQHFHMNYPRTNDPQWSNMWNLNGNVFPNTRVSEAWAYGLNGSGITIAVLDYGIQVDHPDLRKNIDAVNSYDFIDQDSNITPDRISESHGTEVAGIIAAEANNDVCIVGVAHASRIIGERILGDGASLTDITEAKALSHHLSKVDIYSNSWGPQEGWLYKTFGPVTESALVDGVTLGRNGKGVIYVFAAGNGGKEDNCNADGYVSNLYTIPITSIGIDGKAAPYSEVCASAFAATYSGISERQLTSTSHNSTCVSNLVGTSYSAPEASAIVALTLQANPMLTWRDVQHLIVQTSKRHNIDDGFEKQPWQINGAGFNVSQIVGFGMMDAEAMVSLAKTWTLVDQQLYCASETKNVNKNINNSRDVSKTTISELASSIKETGQNCTIRSLEKVQIDVYFSYESRRGDFTLILESPSGTVSYLMTPRPEDSDNTHNVSEKVNWTFTSVHFWGENLQGKWNLSLKYEPEDSLNTHDVSATLISWRLHFYGITKDNAKTPDIQKINDNSSTTAVAIAVTVIAIIAVLVSGLLLYKYWPKLKQSNILKLLRMPKEISDTDPSRFERF
ncbi:furin-like protease kpc-1 isoform X2 [Magallana gigas]|uniref:furin-like protease kpc-1 isoform X2 n=1 Tax=Magallana gigas TaxID=29159 RepID=UPI00333FBC72